MLSSGFPTLCVYSHGSLDSLLFFFSMAVGILFSWGCFFGEHVLKFDECSKVKY